MTAGEARGPKVEIRNQAEGTKTETEGYAPGAFPQMLEGGARCPQRATTSQQVPQSASALDTPRRAEDSAPYRAPLARMAQVSLAVAVLSIASYAGYRWWEHARAWTKTDNAYVAAHIHTVSARVAGTIKQVLVDENQVVAAGSVLARLDPRDFEVRRQQAQAQLAQAQAQVQQAQAQIAQARAGVAREEARATKAAQDFQRATSLYQSNAAAISRQEFEQAQADHNAAHAALQAAQSALESANALAVAAQAQQQVAQASLDDAELQLSYTEILAPAAGRIGKKNLESGNRVQPGQALLALVEPDVWVTANFKETQLGHLKPGQVVHIDLDAFPGRTFSGRVDSLSPASGAQFALLPPDNAIGNFTRIVQRVPVKVLFEAQELADCAGRIVPGMSAIVEVKVR